MGAWSEDSFGNDTACDWASGFLEAPGIGMVTAAIDKVIATGAEYLDSDVAIECIAACEVIARSQGRWGVRNAYSEKLDAFLAGHPLVVPPEVIKRATQAIKRILGDASELVELWDDGEVNAAWHTCMDDLLSRVIG